MLENLKNIFVKIKIILLLPHKPLNQNKMSKKQEEKVVCTICNTEEDEEFTYGYVGLIPVTFCVFCLSGLMDMAEQLNPYESE